MASACASEDLTCSICLSMFTEPVVLQCGHSFCKECISVSLDKQKSCPECRTPVVSESLITNHVLKSLVEKSKEKLQYRQDKEKAAFLCLEHDEKLKLFCVTDQKLICVICRDSQQHESHRFKPVSEAASVVREELKKMIQNISADTAALKTLVMSQKNEVDNTKKRSEKLESLINQKFEEMFEFLQKRKRELTDKVKSDEEDDLKKMNENLNVMEATITENRKLKTTVTSALEIQDRERVLKMWSETEEAKALKGSFKPKARDFRVEKTELSLGPYESHLQMFVWKEMLQIVKPRETQVLLKDNQTNLIVSQDQSSATYCDYKQQQQKLQQRQQQVQQLQQRLHHLYGSHSYSSQSNNLSQNEPISTQSTNTFKEQHYWEVYVGEKINWELGITDNYVKNNAGEYQIYKDGELDICLGVEGEPQKFGIYLNCPKKELSFYNADDMTHIHTVKLEDVSFPVSAHFQMDNSSHDPLVVCRY